MFDYIKMMIDLYTPAAEETDELEGQGMVEYGLILVLVSVVAIVALITVGDNLVEVFDDIADNLGIGDGGGTD